MPALPSDATSESHARFSLALELADACPTELGEEIALAGSVSRGWADALSDIELNFWVEQLDWPGEREAWLRGLGVERMIIDTEPHETGSMWIEFVYRGVWVEAGWHAFDHCDELLHRICAGEVENMYEGAIAESIHHAIVLRDGPHLRRWRDQLSTYPEALRRRMIASATGDWAEPHFFEIGANRVARPDPAIVLIRHERTIRKILRVLHAVNRQWEPDLRKWVRRWADTFEVAPHQLADRILAICERPTAPASYTDLLDLVAETLALMPPEYDVAVQRENVQNARNDWRLQQPLLNRFADK